MLKKEQVIYKKDRGKVGTHNMQYCISTLNKVIKAPDTSAKT